MISFSWNNVVFDMTDIGGGLLDDEIPNHAHAKSSYELHFITGGHGELIADSKKFELENGDFFITGPGVYHSQKSDPSDPLKDVFFMLQAVKTNKANDVASAFLSESFYYSKGFNTAPALELLREYKTKAPDYQSAVIGTAMVILTNVTRLFLPESFVASNPFDSLDDRRFVIIEQAFLYTDNLTLTELSGRLGLCDRQTQRLLKKYYGKSFREKKKERSQTYEAD